MTNCYYQFEIEEKAQKLYAFRTPWGIYEYRRMVMGTSPASSEIQKKIREIICRCPNAIHIKDDILVHGVGQNHDHHLREVLKMLQDKGIKTREMLSWAATGEMVWQHIFERRCITRPRQVLHYQKLASPNLQCSS